MPHSCRRLPQVPSGPSLYHFFFLAGRTSPSLSSSSSSETVWTFFVPFFLFLAGLTSPSLSSSSSSGTIWTFLMLFFLFLAGFISPLLSRRLPQGLSGPSGPSSYRFFFSGRPHIAVIVVVFLRHHLDLPGTVYFFGRPYFVIVVVVVIFFEDFRIVIIVILTNRILSIR